MRSFACRVALAASAFAVANGDVAFKFEEFKKLFKKEYKTPAEELRRFKIFANNMEAAAKLSMLDPGAKYGHLSPLADFSEFEYGKLNTLQVTKVALAEHEKKAIKVPMLTPFLPSEFDWRKKGAVGEIKNQAQCGSCWAFATVANVEGNLRMADDKTITRSASPPSSSNASPMTKPNYDPNSLFFVSLRNNAVTNGKLLSLSEQELVDCDSNDNGCNGGLPSNAYKDLIDNGMGLELESAYGYEARDGTCHAKKTLEKVFLKSWVAIGSSEDQMAAALMKYGPLAIGINAGPMQLYMGGIADPLFCNPAALDHGVAIVAFGVEDGKNYWVIRNSWGGEWGESGYYRIVRGKGKCGLNRMVTSAIVASTGESKALPAPEVFQ
eukprot:g16593.t1